jgi:hypothetical protein
MSQGPHIFQLILGFYLQYLKKVPEVFTQQTAVHVRLLLGILVDAGNSSFCLTDASNHTSMFTAHLSSVGETDNTPS